MKTFKEFMNEAKVSNSSIKKCTELIANYLANKGKIKFTFVDDFPVTSSEGNYIQSLYRDQESLNGIGINWKDDGTFVSLSVYEGDFSKSSKEILIDANNQESFAKYLPRVADILYGNVNESAISEATNTYEYEGETYNGKKELAIAMYKNKEPLDVISKTVRLPRPAIVRVVQAAGLTDDEPTDDGKVKVLAGKAQIVQNTKDVIAANKALSEVKYADPKVIFQDLEKLTKMIADGISPALLVTGQGGVGKSFTIEKVLKDSGLTKGEDYVIMKGHATPAAMYMFLYYHYNKICVFDDCDSVFKDPDGINILKGALDSSHHREISWDTDTAVQTGGMDHDEIEATLAGLKSPGKPSEFEFLGQVIFISNLSKQQIEKKDSALITRCMTLDLTLKAEDVVARIGSVMPTIKYYMARTPKGKPDDMTDEKVKKQVYDYMNSDEFKELCDKRKLQVNFRQFISFCKFLTTGDPDWKRLGLTYGVGG